MQLWLIYNIKKTIAEANLNLNYLIQDTNQFRSVTNRKH